MICPSCRQHLIVVEFEKVELDFCPNCHGVWFDAGELELLLEKASLGSSVTYVDDLLRSPAAPTGENKRKCPICRRAMKKISIGDGRRVLIDACERRDGLWFDGGEVEQLVNILSERAPGGTPRTEMFGFVKEVLKAHHA
jgi:hypothetical protein